MRSQVKSLITWLLGFERNGAKSEKIGMSPARRVSHRYGRDKRSFGGMEGRRKEELVRGKGRSREMRWGIGGSGGRRRIQGTRLAGGVGVR